MFSVKSNTTWVTFDHNVAIRYDRLEQQGMVGDNRIHTLNVRERCEKDTCYVQMQS